jgi:CDP-glucose 4,6-dehydratase
MPFTLEMDTSPQPHEAKRLGLDISKARTQLGWQPQLRLSDAIAMTGKWYLAHQTNQNMQAITRQQINDYFGAA